ncbi:glycosyltransferase [Patulibacter sp. NPDC049589]|uniref:glycosyltransferase n=1 Tax=Patulibacter sp. NPDC049589 TaxID=3154731 RepID=UPI00343ABD83
MPDPVVTVVVPVRDAAADLAGLLGALGRQVGAPAFEVVVADDGSRDDVAAVVRVAPIPVTLVRLPVAEGPAAARNAALAVATGEFVAFTDADCAPVAGWLAALVAPLRGGRAVVQGPIRVPPGADVGPFDRTVQRPIPSGLHETANLAARRSDVVAVGGFSAGPRPQGGKEMGEDVAFGWDLVRAGAPLIWAPDAVVEHPVTPRGWRGAARERARAGAFCRIVARCPEVRSTVLKRGVFLGAHRPGCDLAAAGLVLLALGRITGSRRASRLGAAALAPYAVGLERRSRGLGRRAQPAFAAGLLAGDAVETASLAAGCLRTGTIVL